MSLTSLSFLLIYFPVLLIAYYNPFLKTNTFRKIILVCFSLGLYLFSEPIYIVLLIGIILCNFGLVKLADKTNARLFRAVAIILDVAVLLFFKYINLFLSTFFVNDSVESIVFPIGLSYFIFKAISYVVDSVSVKEGNLLDVTIYISNFLTIVSGPLSTYKDELPSIIKKEPVINHETVYKGLERFIIGLAKKVIIADSLSILVSQCFSSSSLSALMAWTGAIAYSIQLFFDFSGYSDVAIGLGCLFGFNLPENFNYPYMATSITDFWKRWHISLTQWFRQYIYFPLGGSRVKTVARHIFNLFVVWLVTGLWHGSTWTFLIWAMIYFVLQLIEKYTKWADLLKKIHLGHVYTLLIVVLEWVIFKSSSLSSCIEYFKAMFFLGENGIVNATDFSTIVQYFIPFCLGIVFSTNIFTKLKPLLSKNKVCMIFYHVGLILLLLLCLIISISQGYSAPLYAGF